MQPSQRYRLKAIKSVNRLSKTLNKGQQKSPDVADENGYRETNQTYIDVENTHSNSNEENNCEQIRMRIQKKITWRQSNVFPIRKKL